jgi:hypothetical protein
MIAFIISTIGCAMLIAEMFEKLQTNPITVSLAERPSSIQEVSENVRKAQPSPAESFQRPTALRAILPRLRINGLQPTKPERQEINCGLIFSLSALFRSLSQLLPVNTCSQHEKHIVMNSKALQCGVSVFY